MTLIDRTVTPKLDSLASQLRVVIVGGPRQSGKTTLLRRFETTHGGSYRTLDDEQTLRAVRQDPQSFADYGTKPRMLHEVQRGGDELVRAIKMLVDSDSAPGQFILSGSSRFLTVPTLSESLAGRAVFLDLWPLSMPEKTNDRTDVLDMLFRDPSSLLGESDWTRAEYIEAICAGGYPEAIRLSDDARAAWFEGYLITIINRDIRDFASVTDAEALPRLLRLLACQSGSTSVIANLARGIGTTRDTARNYLSYLDMVYLTMRVPGWSTRLTTRLTKTPKLYPTDSGLAAWLTGVTATDLAEPGHSAMGPLVETFAATELLKAISYTNQRLSLSHLRTSDGREVDFILETPQGKLVAIELKASVSPGGKAVQHLRWLREHLGDRMAAGILLHLGAHGDSYGDGIYALPLSTLWSHRRQGPQTMGTQEIQ